MRTPDSKPTFFLHRSAPATATNTVCTRRSPSIAWFLDLLHSRSRAAVSDFKQRTSRLSSTSSSTCTGVSLPTMASVEHCLFCFEALSAHLENREPLSLAEVQKSWAEYAKTVEEQADGAGTGESSGKLPKKLPALRRLAASSSSSGFSSSSSTSSTTSLQQPGDGANSIDTPATSVSSLAAGVPVEPEITESPLFITWNIDSPRHGYHLRGCIGTFEAQPLEEGLSSYALTSALHDTRFSPISLKELPSLEVAVTLLTNFEDAEDAMDWELGKHGLRISFYYHGKRYGATYLPDVAPEQGWDKEETVVSLMRKAGWMGRKDKWQEVDLKVVRYQGRKESLEYSDYKIWRDWVDSQ